MSKSADRLEKFMLAQMSESAESKTKAKVITTNFATWGKKQSTEVTANLLDKEAAVIANIKSLGLSKKEEKKQVNKTRALFSKLQEDWVEYCKSQKAPQ